jgi:hypothetical protein
MTRLFPIRRPAFLALAVAALLVAGFVIPAQGDSPRPLRFVVVVDSTSGRDGAAIAAATAGVRGVRAADGELRITRTPTEQLSVTRYFAARGYAIVGVGLDPAVAVAPVADRYPSVRFALTDARGLPAAVAAVTR